MAASRSGVSAAEFLPDSRDLDILADAAAKCRGCELYRRATQTVFGEGPSAARVVFIGEQPGDEEDRRGRPFVGPAGRLLDEVLEEVGIDRDDVYMTNAVKHFKWEPRGTRRLHSKPSAREVTACRPWLESELQAIEPECVVCLGATAAQSLLGGAFRITKQRGKFLATDLLTIDAWNSESSPRLLATYHPSAILRAPDADARRKMRHDFTADLRKISRELARPRRGGGPPNDRATAIAPRRRRRPQPLIVENPGVSIAKWQGDPSPPTDHQSSSTVLPRLGALSHG